jgi:hypothetical protein
VIVNMHGRTTIKISYFVHASAKLCEITVQLNTCRNLYCTNIEAVHLQDSLKCKVLLMLAQT